MQRAEGIGKFAARLLFKGCLGHLGAWEFVPLEFWREVFSISLGLNSFWVVHHWSGGWPGVSGMKRGEREGDEAIRRRKAEDEGTQALRFEPQHAPDFARARPSCKSCLAAYCTNLYVGPEAKWKYHSPLSESERCGLVLSFLRGREGTGKKEEDKENDSEREKAKRRIEGAGGRDGE